MLTSANNPGLVFF